MEGWREVAEQEFYSVIGQMDVHPRAEGKYPYASSYVTPRGEVKGKAVDYIPEGTALCETRYLLPNTQAQASREAASPGAPC